MNKMKLLVVGLPAALAAILLGWVLWPPSRQDKPVDLSPTGPAESPSKPVTPATLEVPPSPQIAQSPAAGREAAVAAIVASLATPITFYGKVIDQNGEPIADARVGYSALDKFMKPGTSFSGQSDRDGRFSIAGIQGARLSVNVRKEGYYFIDGKSHAAFAYGTGPDGHFRPPPTADAPAVFVLHKMGPTEPLVVVGSRQIDVPRTGQALKVDLATGRTGDGQLEIRSWIGDTNQPQFTWRYRLSVPGGGLVERAGPFAFEAPTDGYRETVELCMDATAERWSSDVLRGYFARLADGRYARFSVNFYPGDRNFVVFESYLNPTPGSRNLEFDPAKAVRPGR